jgi:hypothetical protein
LPKKTEENIINLRKDALLTEIQARISNWKTGMITVLLAIKFTAEERPNSENLRGYTLL